MYRICKSTTTDAATCSQIERERNRFQINVQCLSSVFYIHMRARMHTSIYASIHTTCIHILQIYTYTTRHVHDEPKAQNVSSDSKQNLFDRSAHLSRPGRCCSCARSEGTPSGAWDLRESIRIGSFLGYSPSWADGPASGCLPGKHGKLYCWVFHFEVVNTFWILLVIIQSNCR